MNPITEYALKNLYLEDLDDRNYVIEKSKDQKNIIRLNKHNKSFYIGSRYSVSRDIEYFMKKIGEYNINTIFVVFGLATGEHIFHLINNISKNNKILIIEPDKNIIKLFLNKIENNELILENKRIVVTTCDEDKFNTIVSSFIEEFNVNNIKFITFAKYEKLRGSEYEFCHNVIKNYIKAVSVNIMTNQHFSKQFFKCFVKNIKAIVKSTMINEVKNSFLGVPAIIVSAGPSLEKNIAQLKEVQDKFLIISGGRTVSSLRKVDVTPHIVAVIDAGEPSYEVIKNSLDCTAPLLFCELTNYKVVDEYAGEKIFMQEGYNLSEVTEELLGKRIDSIFQGGSVAHCSASFAKYLGCNPIIFIGQDFAYTNNKLHADIASIEESNENKENTVFVEDIYGEKVQTCELFNVYRRNMEQFIERYSETDFINCTEGGANIKGTKVKDLKEVIKEYGVEKIDKEKLNIFETKSDGINIDSVKLKVKKILCDMKEIKLNSIEALEYSKKILQYYENNDYENNEKKDISKLLRKINEINKEIEKVKFINNLLQPTIFKVLMNPEYMEKLDESENEKGIKFAKQCERLFKDIIESINKAIPYINDCILELSNMEE